MGGSLLGVMLIQRLFRTADRWLDTAAGSHEDEGMEGVCGCGRIGHGRAMRELSEGASEGLSLIGVQQ